MIRNQKIPRGPLLLIGGLSVLAVAVSGALYGQFDYSELCPVCGRARYVVDWQIPGTQRTYYSNYEESETSLSHTVEAEGLVGVHEHRWEFVRGQGNGHSIVLGIGHPIVWSMHSPHMGAFIEAMLRWTDRDTTLRWLNQLRDPRYSRLCQSLADSFSRRTFASRDEWDVWIHQFEAEHSLLINRADEL